ncbi:MAG: serine/threonine protein kinase [Kofleriaceae bacterium]|nr:serine/threonine protein kinase [Kofleriaceae bacterium]
MSGATRKRARSQAVVFGDRYWLTRPIAVGGMAEIFLAKYEGEQGFSKNVVIKRLRKELAGDPRIVAMFRDEARVSGLLNHANTVHVFDSGTHDGLPFIAMEYFPGEELNLLCKRGIGVGEFLPLEHAVELIRQAAVGMGYYHNLRDEAGKRLDLVHCDISPNNLLIGSCGNLQIIDFGIGQFRGQQYRDDQLVPGKLSYMSPEQAKRSRLDHRSDIFALGIVLYEITLGRRLFRGPASEVLPRLIACDVEAPTFVRQDYPGALESIVMRALEAEPSDRYQEAYDFADALAGYLRDERMRTGAVDIARYLDRLTVAEGGVRRDEFIAENERDREPDALNFDRGLFTGFQAMSVQEVQVESWEDDEEEESAIADALGINVELVRTASKAAESGEEELGGSSSSSDSSSSDSSSSAQERKGPQPTVRVKAIQESQGKTQGGRLGILLLMVGVGIALGVGSALLFGG